MRDCTVTTPQVADLYVIDVTRVIAKLVPRSPKELINARLAIRCQSFGIHPDDYGTLEHIFKSVEDSLIDDFFKYSIDSFEFMYTTGYSPINNTPQEIQWFHDNHEAASDLWDILKIIPRVNAGKFVIFYRLKNTVWIAIPKN